MRAGPNAIESLPIDVVTQKSALLSEYVLLLYIVIRICFVQDEQENNVITVSTMNARELNRLDIIYS